MLCIGNVHVSFPIIKTAITRIYLLFQLASLTSPYSFYLKIIMM